MFYSLRFSLLFAMFAVATVAIATITIFAGVATRINFSRYLEAGREIREEQFQQIVLTYYEDQLVDAETMANLAPTSSRAAFSRGNGLYFDSSNLRVYAIPLNDSSDFFITNDQSIREVRLVTAPDGSIEILNKGEPIGSFTTEPMNDLQLIPAQIDFVQSVNYGLLLASSLAGLAAIALTFYLSRRVVLPVIDLTHAARKLKSGDLDHRVRTQARGEIAELAYAFNAMAETLKQNEDLRQKMVSDIAHELRTPLTNIRGYLEAIQDGVVQPDRPTIDMLYDEAVHLANIIQDLQELALAEAGQLRFTRSEVDLGAQIMQTVNALKPTAQAKNIQLQYENNYRAPNVYADESRVGQILRNLVSNAVKYTPEGGTVTVTVATHMKEVEIRVNDTGYGISEEHLPYLFERFYRADPSRTRATGGAGLGLAITRQLVEAMGGRIRVESTLGYGTTFTFSLPKYTSMHEAIKLNPEHQVITQHL